MQTNTHTLEPRAIRGYGILMNGSAITQIDQESFLIPSQSRNVKYLFRKNDENWICECPDHQFRLVQCKNIYDVQLWLNLREKLQPKTVTIKYPEVYECRFCGSDQITRYGKKTKQLQRYYCKAQFCLLCLSPFCLKPHVVLGDCFIIRSTHGTSMENSAITRHHVIPMTR